MKHLFLSFMIGLAGTAIAQQAQPQIYDTFQVNQLSGNGEWMLGRSNSWVDPDDGSHYKESSIVNVKTGELFGLNDLFTLTPYSRAISSKGIAIQSTYDDNTDGMDVPYIIIPGQEPIQLIQLFKTGPYAGTDCYATAITDDASMFLGSYEKYPIQYPFVCKINEDFSINEPEYLPLPETDVFNNEAFFVEMTCISDDGNTVAGTITSVTGAGKTISFPIVYKRTAEGNWQHSFPVEKMVDQEKPFDLTFYRFQVALSPDGNLLACSQETESGLENFPNYNIWTVNLADGEINIINNSNPDLIATRILNDGTILATFFATVRISYILLPGAEDFVDFMEYASEIKPEYGNWMKDNLMQTVIDVTPGGQEVELELPVTGEIFISDDLSTFCAGFQTNEFDQWYNLKLWSYVFTDFVTKDEPETPDGPESAVQAVSISDNDYYDIFNLQGIKVATHASDEDLHNLPNGIYIINNKKVSIRK